MNAMLGEQLRQQARQMKEAAQKLMEAADLLDTPWKMVNRNTAIHEIRETRSVRTRHNGKKSQKQLVVDVLAAAGVPLTRKEVSSKLSATGTALKNNAVSTLLSRMANEGRVVKTEDGKWTVPPAQN